MIVNGKMMSMVFVLTAFGLSTAAVNAETDGRFTTDVDREMQQAGGQGADATSNFSGNSDFDRDWSGSTPERSHGISTGGQLEHTVSEIHEYVEDVEVQAQEAQSTASSAQDAASEAQHTANTADQVARGARNEARGAMNEANSRVSDVSLTSSTSCTGGGMADKDCTTSYSIDKTY